jgi:hypothetical protein
MFLCTHWRDNSIQTSNQITKMAVFWVVAPCSLVEFYQYFRGPCCLHHQGPNDGGSKDLWNVGKLLPDYMTLQPRRQPSSYSPPWQPEILLSNQIMFAEAVWERSCLYLKCNIDGHNFQLKVLGKLLSIERGPLLTIVLSLSWKLEQQQSVFHKDGNVSLARLKLKIYCHKSSQCYNGEAGLVLCHLQYWKLLPISLCGGRAEWNQLDVAV